MPGEEYDEGQGGIRETVPGSVTGLDGFPQEEIPQWLRVCPDHARPAAHWERDNLIKAYYMEK